MVKNFDFYLAGLFEGDGHLWIPSSNIKKKANPRFCITTSEKNKPFLEFLQNQLGDYGFIRKKVSEHALVLTISNRIALKNLIVLLNGKLRTPKISKFNDLIDWINQHDFESFEKKPIDESSLLENSWLAGFLDADGCFYIRVTEGKKNRVAIRMTLDQSICDERGNSYRPAMLQLANTFFSKLYIITKSENRNYFHISFSSLAAINLLDDYLKRYQLYTSKYLDYLNWSETLVLINQQKHYQNLTHIRFLKSQMNSRRVRFDWSFLPRT